MAKRKGGGHAGGHGWYVTFADLMALPNERFALQFGDADLAAQLASGLATPLTVSTLAPYLTASDFTGLTPSPAPTPTTAADADQAAAATPTPVMIRLFMPDKRITSCNWLRRSLMIPHRGMNVRISQPSSCRACGILRPSRATGLSGT